MVGRDLSLSLHHVLHQQLVVEKRVLGDYSADIHLPKAKESKVPLAGFA